MDTDNAGGLGFRVWGLGFRVWRGGGGQDELAKISKDKGCRSPNPTLNG